jgi:hypothetical protein
VPGGGDICASLDVAGAPINVSEEACLADAGTLSAMESTLCLDGSASLEAMANGDSNVPTDYSTLYVLTKGSELVIVDASAEPTFDVTESGDYTIHTLVYNPETLDLTIVEFGVTTGFQVNALLIQGGGNICASLDVPGATFTVEAPDAGTLTALSSTVVLNNGSAQISASPNGDIMIPDGYSSIYVLTQGADLVIVNAGSEPTFTVEEAGLYTIHTLVYNAETLDLGIVELGVTTGVQVFQLIVPGGGDICASLDVMGAQITVEESDVCEAYSGTLYAQDPYQCIDNGSATLTASFNNEANIPDGYEIVYVLTNAYSLTILDAGASPEFEVESPGFYRIHSLVYDPNTLDLSIVQIGQTTGYDVYSLLIEGGGEICGSLNVPGAVFLALPSWFCNWFNYNKNVSEVGDDMSIEKLIKESGNYASFEKSLIETNYSYTIAPNPASDKLIINIELIEAENMNYTLVDASGRVVLKGDINSKNAGTILLEVSDYPNGLYYINFSSEQRNFTEKIQIIH